MIDAYRLMLAESSCTRRGIPIESMCEERGHQFVKEDPKQDLPYNLRLIRGDSYEDS